MLICDTQDFPSQNYCRDSSAECKALLFYSLAKTDEERREVELRGRYSSVNTDSDSSVSQSCYSSSSSEAEHWEYVTGMETEDDVFTEKEVILSYEGLDITDSSSTYDLESTFVDTAELHSETDFDNKYIESFKHESDEEETDVSSELQLPLSDINNDSKHMNINDICLDSFLKWLDNDEEPDSNCESAEESFDSSTDFEYLGNNENSSEFKTGQSQQVFYPSTFDTYYCKNEDILIGNKLPPIQTMIPSGSKIIHSFPSEKCVQSQDSFNSLIRSSPTSLCLDSLVCISIKILLGIIKKC